MSFQNYGIMSSCTPIIRLCFGPVCVNNISMRRSSSPRFSTRLKPVSDEAHEKRGNLYQPPLVRTLRVLGLPTRLI